MVKRKKSATKSVSRTPKKDVFFMGLSRSQTQTLGMGIILAGIVLFAFAGYSYTNRVNITRSILPDGAATTATPTDIPTTIGKTDTVDTLSTPGAGSFGSASQQASATATVSPTPVVTPSVSATPTALAKNTQPTLTPFPSKEASSQAKMADKQLAITKLPNTSSKVTYTVMRNDSLAKIGKQLCGDNRAWLSLARTNNLSSPYTIQPGQTLIVTCY